MSFDVNNSDTSRMWALENERALQRRPFFWVEQPRFSRADRLRIWLWCQAPRPARLLRVTKPAGALGPLASATIFGFQKTAFTAGGFDTFSMDVIDQAALIRWEWDLNVGGTLFRVKAAGAEPITEQQALHAIEIRTGWPVGVSGQLVRVDSTIVSVEQRDVT